LLRRLDQALGRRHEPLIPVTAPPIYHSLNYLLEPIVSQQAILARACRLMQNLMHVLVRDEVGARALRLSLYGVDGTVEAIDIGLTSPTRSVPHVARLIDLKLEARAARHDDGFGFEAIGLAVTRAEPMPGRQLESNIDRHPEARAQRDSKGNGLNASIDILRGPRCARAPQDDDDSERYAALIDALRQRLGPDRVRQFEAIPRHIPECAETLTEINDVLSSLLAKRSNPGRTVELDYFVVIPPTRSALRRTHTRRSSPSERRRVARNDELCFNETAREILPVAWRAGRR
jgi:protein ImuB